MSSQDVFSTRGLSKFLAVLAGREAPVVIDLGPAVGANVTLLAETLGCKLYVEDVLSKSEIWWPPVEAADGDAGTDVDDEGVEAKVETLRAARHLEHSSDSVDGVLCWDVSDYLEADAANTLASEVMRVLKPGGVAFVCHGPEKPSINVPVEYEIIDESSLRYRELRVSRPKPTARESRAMTTMFGGLTISSSFMLTSRMRELVLRKPPATAGAA